MTTLIEAIYEHGVLRLMQPIDLADGTRVEVMVSAKDVATGQATPADILASIAALPLEAHGEEFSGQDHDVILYGPGGAR